MNVDFSLESMQLHALYSTANNSSSSSPHPSSSGLIDFASLLPNPAVDGNIMPLLAKNESLGGISSDNTKLVMPKRPHNVILYPMNYEQYIY